MQTKNKPNPATAKGWSVSNILAEFKRHASTGFDIERLRHEYLIPAIASHAKDIVNGTIAADDKEIKNTLNALVTIVQNAQLEELKADADFEEPRGRGGTAFASMRHALNIRSLRDLL